MAKDLRKFNKGFKHMLYEDEDNIKELKERGALEEMRQILKWTQELEKIKEKAKKKAKKSRRK